MLDKNYHRFRKIVKVFTLNNQTKEIYEFMPNSNNESN